jgi:hypothetical protein
MRLIPSSYRKKSTIQKVDYLNALFLAILLLAASCSGRSAPLTRPAFTDYTEFVNHYSKKADLAEIYGQYAAEQSNKKVRAKFNLLLDPGQRAYIEILDPSDRLLNVLTLSREQIALLWVKDNVYIREQANPATLRAIIGLPVNADDALQLISGQGLQFTEWQESGVLKDGWKLVRGPASAQIKVKENLSRIETTTGQGSFLTIYEKYELLSDKSMPTRIRFEIPERKTNLELRIAKYLPRAEQATADLFEVKLPANAKKLALNDVYRGRPLLMD